MICSATVTTTTAFSPPQLPTKIKTTAQTNGNYLTWSTTPSMVTTISSSTGNRPRSFPLPSHLQQKLQRNQRKQHCRRSLQLYDYYHDNDNHNDRLSDTDREEEEEEVDRPNTSTSTSSSSSTNNRSGYYYQVHFSNDNIDPSETQLDWETCYWYNDNDDDDDNDFNKSKKRRRTLQQPVLVLLPPAAIERPRAILHFVGGTFFGSAPKLWYRKLLEGIVRNTQTAVIVTPIPITIFQSPLQHTQLSQTILQALQYAWYNVLEDEYGSDLLQDIPLCGIGHSLGARLLTVLTTANQNNNNNNNNKKKKKKKKNSNKGSGSRIPPYKALILISFTNYGASAGIPGIGSLWKQARKQEQISKVDEERQRYQRARKARNDWWLEDKKNDDYYYNNNNNDDDDDDDDIYYKDNDDGRDDREVDWADIVEEFQSLVETQATRVKTALTPPSQALEFFPTPDQLWKAMGDDGRYVVNETLLVQFDQDPIDQSSKLAQILTSETNNSTNIKFARLRGTHLTPITTTVLQESDMAEQQQQQDDDDDAETRTSFGQGQSMLRRSNTVASLLWKSMVGKSKTKQQEMAMQELRQSIVSYINDIVVP
jgi:hypothetical protein